MGALPVSILSALVFVVRICAQTPTQEIARPATEAVASQKATSQPADSTPPPLKPVPKLSDAEMEAFLKTARIVDRKKLDTGTTGASRVTLSDGKLTHDAQYQGIDVFKPVFRGAEGTVEKNFRDSYKFNIAAYRLGKLIGIDTIPMSVERDIDGRLGSMTWWLDNIWITEMERRDKGIKPPASQFWVDALNIVRVFDQLIYNTDRNQGNLLITPDWKLWMIDHTRAFRTTVALQKKNALPGRVDHKLLRGLRELNSAKLTQALSGYLRPEEISAILGRRDIIVAHFDSEIKQKGEDSVLTGLPRKTPEVSLP
ncbi:MAG TPA: hypothetical protein VEX68_03555 [Bryobacteraceae bacterium]|nr:hypothetical protein [Bryobacteraceae bacterium]